MSPIKSKKNLLLYCHKFLTFVVVVIIEHIFITRPVHKETQLVMKTINFRVELLPFLNRDLNTAYGMSDIKLPWYNRTFQCFICSVL